MNWCFASLLWLRIFLARKLFGSSFSCSIPITLTLSPLSFFCFLALSHYLFLQCVIWPCFLAFSHKRSTPDLEEEEAPWLSSVVGSIPREPMTASSTHIALRFSIGIEAGFVGNWLYFIALTEALPTAGRSSQMPGSPAEKDRPDILLSLFFFSIFFIFLQLTLIPPCSCCSSVFHRFISIAHWAETFL